MGRLGYAARGLAFLLVGWSAISAALSSGHPHGITEILQRIASSPLRLSAAAVIAVGIACFAGYFAIVGVIDLARSRATKLWALAAGRLGDAAVYLGLAIAALGVAFGMHRGGEHETQTWAAWLLQQPFGRGLAAIAGCVVLVCGIGLVFWAMTGDVEGDVALPQHEKRMVQPIGRYGEAGRGLAISLIGVYWIAAAVNADPAKAHALGGALQAVRHNPAGQVFLLLLGLAFAASALLELVEAIFRRTGPTQDLSRANR
jgi:hypothetical protein